MNPMASTDGQVDQILGSAYQVIKYVATNMEILISLAESLDPLVDSMQTSFEALRRTYFESGYILLKATFKTGAAIGTNSHVLLDDATGIAYSWGGALPKFVPEGSTVESSGGVGLLAWIPQDLSSLRMKLASATGVDMVGGAVSMSQLNTVLTPTRLKVNEALRRIYGDSGYNLVAGSFELGGVVTSSNDVLLYEAEGRAYRWAGSFSSGPKVIPQGSSPASTGGINPVNGWDDVDDASVYSRIHTELSSTFGSSLVGGALYSHIAAYSGSATRLEVYGGLVVGDGGEGTVVLDSSDTTSPAVTGMIWVDALGRRWKRKYEGDIQAKWFLIKGDKVTDDTAKFIEAASFCKANKKRLDISDLKIVLRTLSAPINLDDWRVVGNGVPSVLPTLHLDYLNGDDHADSVWLQEADFIGSAIYCPANVPAFTGKMLNINDVLLVGNYNQPNNDAFLQSTPTSYPGWAHALENSSVTIHYFGGWGIKLLGGLEVCNLKNIKVAFTKKNCLHVGKTTGINCPIEYVTADETCYFMYSKINNVLLDGFRKVVDFSNCLLNGPGQLDVVKHFNPSYVLPSIGNAWAAVSVVVEPIGGLHTSSFNLKMDGCYAEACQNLLTISGGFINNVSFENTTMYPVDGTWPKAHLITYNQIAKIKTEGNQAPDGKFYYWLDATTRNSLVALDIGEDSLSAAVNVGGAVDPNKKMVPNRNSFIALGNGLGGDTRFDLDSLFAINTAEGTSAKSIMLLVASNFGTTAAPSMGAYIVIASRHASNSWVGVVIPSGSNTGFTSPPIVAADGQLSFNLAAGYYASATRIDGVQLS